MTNGARVVLLRMLRDMNDVGIVSIPRDTLAADLGVAPQRISENIAVAVKCGLLTRVKRGQPGTTAVYQAVLPGPGMGTPQRTHIPGIEVRKPGGVEWEREGVPVPSANPQVDHSNGYATAFPIEGHPPLSAVPAAPGPAVAGRSSYDEGDLEALSRPTPVGPGAAGTGLRAMDGINDHSSKSKNRRPWAALQAKYDNAEIDDDDVMNHLDQLLDGLDDAEEREALGMLADGRHVKAIFYKLRADRRVGA